VPDHRPSVAENRPPRQYAGMPRMLCWRCRAERQAMAFFWFLFGVLIGLCGLVLLPLLIAVMGAVFALGLVVILPLLLACLILFGILAAAPTLAYGLAIAAILVLLWASERRRQRR
jgi:hypothetical protein